MKNCIYCNTELEWHAIQADLFCAPVRGETLYFNRYRCPCCAARFMDFDNPVTRTEAQHVYDAHYPPNAQPLPGLEVA